MYVCIYICVCVCVWKGKEIYLSHRQLKMPWAGRYVGQPWAGYSCRPTLGRLLTLSVSFAFDDLQSTFAESNSKLAGV